MLETLLKRDRAIILAGLIVIILLAWLYLLYLAQGMMGAGMDMSIVNDAGLAQESAALMPTSTSSSASMGGMDMSKSNAPAEPSDANAAVGTQMGAAMVMPQSQAWTLSEFMLMFVMWSTMMVAMMLPSAAPMILLFAATNRKQEMAFSPFERTSLFVVGYLLVWAAFSLLATSAQGLLHAAALLSPAMATTNTMLAAILLLVAGVYQWTPYKYTCLHHCHSPLSFLLNHWRPGSLGAVRMGAEHGGYCLGCCWALMALLFVAGVMNLLWIAILAALVLVEKVAPVGHYLSRIAGVVFMVWGIWLAASVIV